MLIGKKRKSTNETEESTDLHKHPSVLEYQNRCLIERLDTFKADLLEEKDRNKILESTKAKLCKILSSYASEMSCISELVRLINQQNNIGSINTKDTSGMQAIIDIINSRDISLIEEDIKSMLGQLSENILNMLNGLIAIIQCEKENRERSLSAKADSIEKCYEDVTKEIFMMKKDVEDRQIRNTLVK
jgi:hypothetical protein